MNQKVWNNNKWIITLNEDGTGQVTCEDVTVQFKVNPYGGANVYTHAGTRDELNIKNWARYVPKYVKKQVEKMCQTYHKEMRSY